MPTYLYQVISTGAQLEVEQSIREPAHTVLEVDGELVSVKRLISGPGSFQLISGDSGGWSNTGYSKAPHERAAEHTLGRKLHKAAR